MSKACFHQLLPGRQEVKVERKGKFLAHSTNPTTQCTREISMDASEQVDGLTLSLMPLSKECNPHLLHWDHPAASSRRLWLHWEAARKKRVELC